MEHNDKLGGSDENSYWGHNLTLLWEKMFHHHGLLVSADYRLQRGWQLSYDVRRELVMVQIMECHDGIQETYRNLPTNTAANVGRWDNRFRLRGRTVEGLTRQCPSLRDLGLRRTS